MVQDTQSAQAHGDRRRSPLGWERLSAVLLLGEVRMFWKEIEVMGRQHCKCKVIELYAS